MSRFVVTLCILSILLLPVLSHAADTADKEEDRPTLLYYPEAEKITSPMVEKNIQGVMDVKEGAGKTLKMAIPQAPQISAIAIAPAATTVVTGLLVKSQIMNSIHSILNHVNDIGKQLVTQIQQEAEVSIRQLDDILGKDISKPIDELNDTMRLAVDRATVVSQQLSSVVNATMTCTSQDVRLIASLVDASLSQNVNDITFWKKAKQFVATGYVLGYESRMGIYIDRGEVPYRFVGAFDGLDQNSDVNVVSKRNGNVIADVKALSADLRSIVVNLPNYKEPGVYSVEIKYKKKRLIGHKDVTLNTFLVVMPKPVFLTSYEIKPTCLVDKKEQNKIIAQIRLGNRDCDGDKGTSVQLCPDLGTKYDSFEVADRNTTEGCTHSVQVISPCVRLNATCKEKGHGLGLSPFCDGPNKWTDLDLILYQLRPTPIDASPIKGTFKQNQGYAQTIREDLFKPSWVPVPEGQEARLCTWSDATQH